MKQLKLSILQKYYNNITSFFHTKTTFEKIYPTVWVYHHLLNTQKYSSILSNIWSSKTTFTFHNKI
jgi:hypothetical protein